MPQPTNDCETLLGSEKHVLFDPELQYHEIQDIRSSKRKQIHRGFRILGLLSIVLGFLFYSHLWKRLQQFGYHCAMTESTPNHKTASFTFDDIDQFSLNEILDNQGYVLLNISGTITLTSAPAAQDAAILANISMTSHHIEIESTKFDSTRTGLIIGNPKLKNPSDLRRPTITLDVAVHVKPGAKLSDLKIETRQLHIKVDPSLDLTVSDTTTLAAVSGQVISPPTPANFSSRKKYIRSVSGGIYGSSSLEDILSCTTTSGTIRISVTPKEAGEHVVPAAFSAKSTSGHCNVEFGTEGAPEREYTVDVQGGIGGVSGTYIHGSRTKIESASGSMRVTIVPFDGSGGEIVTQGASGANAVVVRSPLRESKTLGELRSSHHSVSGSLKLTYPSEWAGKFEGTSVSGSLSAEGPGLVVEKGGSPGLKMVSGQSKLDGEAELSFGSVSGGASLVVV